jgi:hypothetical protein
VWPSPEIRSLRYRLSEEGLLAGDSGDSGSAARGALGPRPVGSSGLTVQSPLTVGLFAGKWCSYAETPDLPHDQREEDGGALVFDSPTLTERTEVLGAAVAELEIAVNKPVAMVAVRLSDLAADDKATRVTYGLLNLTHRESDKDPQYLEPGTRYRVRVQLNHVAQVFPVGHRIRLALSTSYWPLAVPPPEPVRLTVFPEGSSLELPLREPRESDAALTPFPEPEAAAPLERTLLRPTAHNWWVLRDLARDESTLEVLEDDGTYRFEDTGLEYTKSAQEWYSSRDDDFASLRGETRGVRAFKRGTWETRSETRTVLTCDRRNFYLHAELDAYESGKRIYSTNWDCEIPRDYV